MELLAASILLSTILYLVDKNRCWRVFWRVSAALILVAVLGGAGLYFYAEHHQKSQATPNVAWDDASKLPPGYTLDKPKK
jgi:uncharacterized membrane protein YsdA (DUF1294 family)